MIKKIGVLTSGGDAQGMNACIRSVVRTSWQHNIVPYGIERGYEGLINNLITKMDPRSVGNIVQLGGTMLKCARSKRFRTKEGRKQAYDNLMAAGIDALVIIGGDGSLTGATIFSQEYNIPVIGIPATIDNDIYGTDFTIGFDTAANVALDAIDKIRDTADSHNRIFFIEIMGRESGALALQVGLASGAEIVMIPEILTQEKEIFEALETSINNGKTSHIIVVAEGNKSGSIYEIANKVEERFIDFEAKVAILGHIQRGGSPSCYDRILASEFGVYAVKQLISGNSNVMVGTKNRKLILQPIEKVLNGKSEIDKNLLDIGKVLTSI